MAESNIQRILDYAREQHATDIHIHAGSPVLFRIGRELTPATQQRLNEDATHKLAAELLGRGGMELTPAVRDYDFMVGEGDRRYRVNVGQFNGKLGAVIRILPERPGTPEELRLPAIVSEFCDFTKGLVLITGSTSQGKTTTMASLIDQINTHSRKHIITIEDPIEYIHADKQGIVRQREVGRDTPTFAQGLRAALRQDPDVIAIGEMRDYETIKIALTAAETGILVISTLHTMSIDKIIERILSYVPPEEESHIRYVMADALQAVVHQELVPTIDGRKRVACEVLIATDASRNIMRRKGMFMLRNVITTGRKHDMMTMSESLQQLVAERVITDDTAHAILANYPG